MDITTGRDTAERNCLIFIGTDYAFHFQKVLRLSYAPAWLSGSYRDDRYQRASYPRPASKRQSMLFGDYIVGGEI